MLAYRVYIYSIRRVSVIWSFIISEELIDIGLEPLGPILGIYLAYPPSKLY